MRTVFTPNKPVAASLLAVGISLLSACGGGGGGGTAPQTFGVVALNTVGTIGILDGNTQALSSLKFTGELGSYGGGLFDVAISPDGKTTAVSNFGDAEVFFIDTTHPDTPLLSGSVTTSYMDDATPPKEVPVFAEDVAFTPDGRYLLVTDGGFSPTIFVIDVANRAIVEVFNDTDDTVDPPTGHSHQSVAVAADGRTVLTVDYFGAVVNVLTLSADGHLAFVNSIDVSNPVWDPVAKENVPTLRPVNVEISPDGRMAIVAAIPGNKDKAGTLPADMVFPVLKIASPGVVTLSEMKVSSTVLTGSQSVAFNRTGSKAYVICTQPLPDPIPTDPDYLGPKNVIKVLDVRAASRISDPGISVEVEIYGRSQLFGVDTLAVDNPGKYLYVSNPTVSGGSSHIQVVDLATNTLVKTIAFDPFETPQGTPPVPTSTPSIPTGISFWHP